MVHVCGFWCHLQGHLKTFDSKLDVFLDFYYMECTNREGQAMETWSAHCESYVSCQFKFLAVFLDEQGKSKLRLCVTESRSRLISSCWTCCTELWSIKQFLCSTVSLLLEKMHSVYQLLYEKNTENTSKAFVEKLVLKTWTFDNKVKWSLRY